MQKDNLEIILEDIRGKFDLVLEGHEVLRKEIRDTREDLSEKIGFVDFKVNTLNQRVNTLDQKVGALDQKVNTLDQKVGALDQKVNTLDQKLDAVASDLAAHRRDTEVHPSVYKVKEDK